jgi:hypothetical protein
MKFKIPKGTKRLATAVVGVLTWVLYQNEYHVAAIVSAAVFVQLVGVLVLDIIARSIGGGSRATNGAGH